jgi:lactate dehydrogenase-like 2-hydroxyacid dehydrogenase
MSDILIIDSLQTPYIDNLSIEQEIFQCNYLNLKQGIQSCSAMELRMAKVVVIFYGNTLNAQHIQQMLNCCGIVVATTGYNHVDINAASKAGIPVCNLINPTYEDVADHTMLLILASIRKLKITLRSIENKQWNWQAAYGIQRLKDQTLGLIGYGNIGQAVAIRAAGFGFNIITYDPFYSDIEVTKVSTLRELLINSDIVSLHCPLTSSTYHLLNKNTLEFCRTGVVIINTARGELIDQKAAIQLLKKGKIGALGLDVLEDESLIPQELIESASVILTPHMAFYSTYSHKAFRTAAAQAAVNFLAQKGYLNNIINDVK